MVLYRCLCLKYPRHMSLAQSRRDLMEAEGEMEWRGGFSTGFLFDGDSFLDLMAESYLFSIPSIMSEITPCDFASHTLANILG